MAHLSEGVLRRMHDEALAVSGAARRHYEDCAICQQRMVGLADEAAGVQALFGPANVEVDARAAFQRMQPRLAAEQASWRARLPLGVLNWSAPRRALTLAGAAAVMLLVVALSPLPTLVGQRLFVVNQGASRIVPITVTSADFQDVPDLSAYGTVHGTPPKVSPAANSAAVQAVTGFRLPTPASLPTGAPATPQYVVMTQTTGTFTFSAAKAASSAGKPLPPMPSGMDGSTLSVTVGPGAAAVYGGHIPAVSNFEDDGSAPPVSNSAAAPGADPGSTAEAGVENFSSMLPSLVIAEAHTPTVTSTGVTAKQLESYLLAQPGISKNLAAQIRAIGDPTTTLPVPIPAGMAGSHQMVTVQGVPGVFYGDKTGIAGEVIWVKSGMIYVVAGSLTQSEAVSIANSLH